MDKILLMLLGFLVIFVGFFLFAYSNKNKLSEKKVKEFFSNTQEECEEECEGECEEDEDGQWQCSDGAEYFEVGDDEQPEEGVDEQPDEGDLETDEGDVETDVGEGVLTAEDDEGVEEEYFQNYEAYENDNALSSYNRFGDEEHFDSEQARESYCGGAPQMMSVNRNGLPSPAVSGQNALPCLNLFYADWCGHCNRFKPTFEQLEKVVKANNIACNIKAINEKGNGELLKQYNVQGFPTLILEYPNGKKTEYNGDRSIDDLVRFLSGSLN